MTTNPQDRRNRSRRRYLLLALAVVCAATLVAVLWLLPRLMASDAGTAGKRTVPTTTATPLAVVTAELATAPLQASMRTSPPPTVTGVPTVARAPAVERVPTHIPGPRQPTITDLSADVNDKEGTITFTLEAAAPSGRRISEVLLWYDTEAGHELRRFANPLPERTDFSYRVETAQEGLTRTLTTTRELDYWWLVRDSSGETVRAGGTAILGPTLLARVTTHFIELPPIGFTWATSSTVHFLFHYVPGTSAERDLRQLGGLAEASLVRTSGALGIEFDGQMSIYFVPRVFWQGGATYSDKVQLISYLDRNYTGVETWSYFTHEGTHALAQELLQPKKNGGGPDGVLVEGLAVWASGGHYRQEPIDAWAAVVAGSSEYLPLAELRKGPFYDFQHETSYLEGASFVKFLIDGYGLDSLIELYGLGTGDREHDEALVEGIYGKEYGALEADWLEYLAGVVPTDEQAESWRLKVRSFDLMRRYETELDPDARVLPPKPPPEWTTDTLKIFLRRLDAPVNVALETALMEVQERLYIGDLSGAERIMDDVESALDAGGSLQRPTIQARQAILELLLRQDRAILRGDREAYLSTVHPASTLSGKEAVAVWLPVPLTAYRQELVRLDVADDGQRAQGVVLVHGQADGEELAEDGHLFSVSFVTVDGQGSDGWLILGREPVEPTLPWPPSRESSLCPCQQDLCRTCEPPLKAEAFEADQQQQAKRN